MKEQDLSIEDFYKWAYHLKIRWYAHLYFTLKNDLKHIKV